LYRPQGRRKNSVTAYGKTLLSRVLEKISLQCDTYIKLPLLAPPGIEEQPNLALDITSKATLYIIDQLIIALLETEEFDAGEKAQIGTMAGALRQKHTQHEELSRRLDDLLTKYPSPSVESSQESYVN
jgi:hypothetical protein